VAIAIARRRGRYGLCALGTTLVSHWLTSFLLGSLFASIIIYYTVLNQRGKVYAQQNSKLESIIFKTHNTFSVPLTYMDNGNFEVINVREHESTSEAMEKELRLLRRQLSMTQNHLLAAMKTSLFPVSPTDSPRIISETSAPCSSQKVCTNFEVCSLLNLFINNSCPVGRFIYVVN